MSTKDNNEHLLERQEKWIFFTSDETIRLFVYYIIVLLVSLIWIVFSISYHYECSESGFSSVQGAYMIAFPAGVLGATIYYIRKLYKSCIQNLVVDSSSDEKNDKNLKIRKIGAKMYFYLRPIISGILAMLIHFGIITGFYTINNQPVINNDSFFLFMIIISFYIGFCNGKVIIKIEKQGEDIVNNIFRTKENKKNESREQLSSENR